MRRSSIFSSDESARGRWPVWALLVVILLAGAEALLRVPLVRDWLPARTHYYDSSVAVRLDALERTLRRHGRIDVLFVGSSVVRTNIQPLTFDRLVQRRTGGTLVSFNAGLSGLWPTAVSLYLERLWLPAAAPRLVVQGIRYPELAATTHALRPDQVFSGRVEAGWVQPTLARRIYSAAASHLHLLQYRGTLVDVLRQYVNGRPDPRIEGDGRYAIDPRGYTPRLPTLRDARARGLVTTEEAFSGRICPDGCGVGFAALKRTIDAVRAAGAEYVLVNIPEHGTRWRGASGRERYRDYLTALERFASSESVRFLDPSQGDPYLFESDVDYSDTYHMTPSGAQRFTIMLAEHVSDVGPSPAGSTTIHLATGHISPP